MVRAADQVGLISFHVKRLDTATREGDVHHLLIYWQKFPSLCGHFHTLCERTTAGK